MNLASKMPNLKQYKLIAYNIIAPIAPFDPLNLDLLDRFNLNQLPQLTDLRQMGNL